MDGNIQSGLPDSSPEMQNFGNIAPVVGDGWVQLGGDQGKKIFWDELSQADQNMVLQYLYFLSFQTPILVPPQQLIFGQDSGKISATSQGVSIAEIAIMTEQKKHEIIMGMLDGWLKNIQEITEQSKKDYDKKVIQALDTAFQAYRDQGSDVKEPFFSLFSVGMIIVGTGVFQAMLPNKVHPEITQVGTNPVMSMFAQVSSPIVADMVALGMIGAIYGAGIQYFTVAEMAAKGTGDKDKPKDTTFAKGYAENVVKLINSQGFNAYLMAIVTQSAKKGESVSPESAYERAAMVKMILLSTALAILYQAETGKMTGTEFAGMLNGTIRFEAGNIRATLVSLIRSNLNLVQDPKVRASVLTALLSYFDKDPSIETLSEPAKVFAELKATLHRGDLPS